MPECMIHLKFIPLCAFARCSNFCEENVIGQKSDSGKLLGSWNLCKHNTDVVRVYLLQVSLMHPQRFCKGDGDSSL